MSIDLMRDMFITPLMKNKPKFMTESDFAKIIFSTLSREIYIKKMKDNVPMPGILIDGPGVMGNLKKRQKMVIRKDAATTYYDVDVSGSWYRLSSQDYEILERHTYADGPRHRNQ